MVQKISGLYSSNSWLVGTESASPRTRYGPPRSKTSAPVLPNPTDASSAASTLLCWSLRVRAVGMAFSKESHRSGEALTYTSANLESCWVSARIWGIRGFRSARMSLPSTIDSPNLVPNPSSACAVAVSVWFNFTGSTFSDIEVIVSNNVLISVVTEVTSITSPGEIRCGTGFFGDLNDTYLLPNTVVAVILASTLAGIRSRYS